MAEKDEGKFEEEGQPVTPEGRKFDAGRYLELEKQGFTDAEIKKIIQEKEEGAGEPEEKEAGIEQAPDSEERAKGAADAEHIIIGGYKGPYEREEKIQVEDTGRLRGMPKIGPEERMAPRKTGLEGKAGKAAYEREQQEKLEREKRKAEREFAKRMKTERSPLPSEIVMPSAGIYEETAPKSASGVEGEGPSPKEAEFVKPEPVEHELEEKEEVRVESKAAEPPENLPVEEAAGEKAAVPGAPAGMEAEKLEKEKEAYFRRKEAAEAEYRERRAEEQKERKERESFDQKKWWERVGDAAKYLVTTKEGGGRLAKGVYDAVGRRFGTKTLTDWGIYGIGEVYRRITRKEEAPRIFKRGDVYEYFKEKRLLKGKKDAIGAALDELLGKSIEIRERIRQGKPEHNADIRQAISDFEKTLKEAGISKSSREGVDARQHLALILKQYRNKDAYVKGEAANKTRDAVGDYLKTKISGFNLAQDAVNSALMLSGFATAGSMWLFRFGASYPLMALGRKFYEGVKKYGRGKKFDADLKGYYEQVKIGEKWRLQMAENLEDPLVAKVMMGLEGRAPQEKFREIQDGFDRLDQEAGKGDLSDEEKQRIAQARSSLFKAWDTIRIEERLPKLGEAEKRLEKGESAKVFLKKHFAREAVELGRALTLRGREEGAGRGKRILDATQAYSMLGSYFWAAMGGIGEIKTGGAGFQKGFDIISDNFAAKGIARGFADNFTDSAQRQVRGLVHLFTGRTFEEAAGRVSALMHKGAYEGGPPYPGYKAEGRIPSGELTETQKALLKDLYPDGKIPPADLKALADVGVEPALPIAEAKGAAVPLSYEAKIEAKGLNSIYRATASLVEAHSAELGFQGEPEDLPRWKELAANSLMNRFAATSEQAGNILDKVFAGDAVRLARDKNGEWGILFENKSGLVAGHLPDDNVERMMGLVTRGKGAELLAGFKTASGVSVEAGLDKVGDQFLDIKTPAHDHYRVFDWDRNARPNVQMPDGTTKEFSMDAWQKYLENAGIIEKAPEVSAEAGAYAPKQAATPFEVEPRKTAPEVRAEEKELGAIPKFEVPQEVEAAEVEPGMPGAVKKTPTLEPTIEVGVRVPKVALPSEALAEAGEAEAAALKAVPQPPEGEKLSPTPSLSEKEGPARILGAEEGWKGWYEDADRRLAEAAALEQARKVGGLAPLSGVSAQGQELAEESALRGWQKGAEEKQGEYLEHLSKAIETRQDVARERERISSDISRITEKHLEEGILRERVTEGILDRKVKEYDGVISAYAQDVARREAARLGLESPYLDQVEKAGMADVAEGKTFMPQLTEAQRIEIAGRANNVNDFLLEERVDYGDKSVAEWQKASSREVAERVAFVDYGANAAGERAVKHAATLYGELATIRLKERQGALLAEIADRLGKGEDMNSEKIGGLKQAAHNLELFVATRQQERTELAGGQIRAAVDGYFKELAEGGGLIRDAKGVVRVELTDANGMPAGAGKMNASEFLANPRPDAAEELLRRRLAADTRGLVEKDDTVYSLINKAAVDNLVQKRLVSEEFRLGMNTNIKWSNRAFNELDYIESGAWLPEEPVKAGERGGRIVPEAMAGEEVTAASKSAEAIQALNRTGAETENLTKGFGTDVSYNIYQGMKQSGMPQEALTEPWNYNNATKYKIYELMKGLGKDVGMDEDALRERYSGKPISEMMRDVMMRQESAASMEKDNAASWLPLRLADSNINQVAQTAEYIRQSGVENRVANAHSILSGLEADREELTKLKPQLQTMAQYIEDAARGATDTKKVSFKLGWIFGQSRRIDWDRELNMNAADFMPFKKDEQGMPVFVRPEANEGDPMAVLRKEMHKLMQEHNYYPRVGQPMKVKDFYRVLERLEALAKLPAEQKRVLSRAFNLMEDIKSRHNQLKKELSR